MFFPLWGERRASYESVHVCLSISIVSDYGLDDRTIEVPSPAEANVFFL
jgi:hypothetical protein